MKISRFKNGVFFVGVLSCLTLFTNTSCTDSLDDTTYFTTDAMTIVETLESQPESFSSYVEILIKTDHYNALSSYGKYTSFVPENDAVSTWLLSEWGVSTVDEMVSEEQLEALDMLVRFHTMPARKYTSSFVEGRMSDTTFTGDFLTTSYPLSGGIANMLINKEAKLVKYDIAADNGVVHSLNKVLTPFTKAIPEVIAEAGLFSIFTEALQATGYDSIFSQNKTASGNNLNYTLFAESDEVYEKSGITSFAELAEKYAPEATDLTEYTDIANGLNRFIAYHATAAFLYAPDIPDEGFVSTVLDGSAIKVLRTEDYLKLNESETGGDETWTSLISAESNNPAKNGVYHSVDTLLDIFTPSAAHIIFDVVESQPEFQSKLVTSHQYVESTGYEYVSWYPEKTQRFLQSSDKAAYGTNGSRFDLNGCIWYEFVTPIVPKGKYELLICALGRSSSRGQFQIYWDDEPIGGIYDLTGKATSLGMSSDATYNLGGANEGQDSAAMEAYNWRRGLREITNRDGDSAFDDTGACRYIITKALLCPVQKQHRIKLVAVKAGVVPLDYIEFIPVVE